MKYLAPVFGFFEVFIWLLAISQIMQHLNHLGYYIVYAGGFSAGTFVGIYLENKIAIGVSLIRIIVQGESEDLVQQLHAQGYGVTCLEAQGKCQPAKLIFSIVQRKEIPQVLALLERFHPGAIYTIEDLRSARMWTRDKQGKA